MYDNYARIRDKKGFTDYEVSKAIGISRSVLSEWKNGKHSPSKKNRTKISQFLGLPPTDYFFSDDEKSYLIEAKSNSKSLLENRISAYQLKLLSGQSCDLNPEEYSELKNAVDIFIDSWIRSKKKL